MLITLLTQGITLGIDHQSLTLFDESVEYVLKKFSKPQTMSTMASSMANGASILELTNFTVLTMIEKGSVTQIWEF